MAQAKKKATAKKSTKDLKKAEKVVARETTKVVEELVVDEKLAELIEKVEEDLKTSDDKPIAKAGKRSSKALKEQEELKAKEERKLSKVNEKELPKRKPIIVRSRIERKGKKYQEASKLIDKNKEYNLKEALELVTKTNPVKFDATVEMHIRLSVDPKQADQNIRANLVLPSGSGKTSKVAVFAEADKVASAKKAGADIAGEEVFLQQLDKEKIDFDVLIATPAMMPKLGKYARLLGPKGLMPNSKSGTVTVDIEKAISEAKAGKVEYRVDSTGIVHVAIGKISFGPNKLLDNAKAVLASIKATKPASIKNVYILSIYASSSMAPSVKIAATEA